MHSRRHGGRGSFAIFGLEGRIQGKGRTGIQGVVLVQSHFGLFATSYHLVPRFTRSLLTMAVVVLPPQFSPLSDIHIGWTFQRYKAQTFKVSLAVTWCISHLLVDFPSETVLALQRDQTYTKRPTHAKRVSSTCNTTLERKLEIPRSA